MLNDKKLNFSIRNHGGGGDCGLLKKACPDEEGSCYLSPPAVETMGTALLCLITFPQKPGIHV